MTNVTYYAFSALADPVRRGIVARLAQGEATVGELAKPFAHFPTGHLATFEGPRESRADHQ